MPILTVAAPPDDKTMGAGGTMVYHAARGDRVWVAQAGDEFVAIANTGAVPMDIDGWLLVNKGTAKRSLPGRFVRIHSGAGKSDKNDLYLSRQVMWGAHATALLRNDRSVLMDRLRF